MPKNNAKMKLFNNIGLKLKPNKSGSRDSLKDNYNMSLENRQFSNSPVYFCQRYNIEVRRAENNKYEFSLIVIDLFPVDAEVRITEDEEKLKRFESTIFAASRAIIRDTDVITKYGDSRYAILLPDANSDGGKSVVQRIDNSMRGIADDNILPFIKQVSTYLYCYPSQEVEMTQLIYGSVMNNSLFESEV